MLPVTLHARRGRTFTLTIDDGAFAQPNQCLLEKLRVSKGLTIPQFEEPEDDDSGIDLEGSLGAIRHALLEASLPYVVEEHAQLALLQFSTLPLWQDVSDHWEQLLESPVVRHLVETPTDSFVDPRADEPIAQDEATTYCPISVDGSQLQAVQWAAAGRSFVLEGPPGTGKSQTITNLVANAIALGKTVLFVAEKQAALEVVQRRLDKVGLGELCLDVHAKGQSPQEVRRQLRAALHLHAEGDANGWAARRARQEGAVQALGRYPEALHAVGPAGLSAWDARQVLLAVGPGPTAAVDREAVSGPLDQERVYRLGRELATALFDLGGAAAEHPWHPARGSRLPDSRRGELRAALDRLSTAFDAMAGTALEGLIDSTDDPTVLRKAAAWVGATRSADRVLSSDTAGSSRTTEAVERRANAASRLVEVRRLATGPLETFRAEAFDGSVDFAARLADSQEADGKLLKSKRRRAIIDALSPSLHEGATLDPKQLTPMLERCAELTSAAQAGLTATADVPGVEVPPTWQPLQPDSQEILDKQLTLLDATAALLDAPGAADVIDAAPREPLAGTLAEALTTCADAWEVVIDIVGATPSSIDAWRGGTPLAAALRRALPVWVADARADFVRLGRWLHVRELVVELESVGVAAFAEQALVAELHLDELEEALRRGIAKAALGERMSASALAGFDGLQRDRRIAAFEDAAEELRRDMVAELPAHVVDARSFRPDRMIGRVGELSRELSRQRGGKKIRELFAAYGPVIGELTPCLMMSPHSVARFLPPGAMEIDLVVFDEASQIKVAEAISAVGRAKAIVVVGDSQQMPPTAGFSGTAQENPDTRAALDIPADMDSLLSEAVESNLPRLWLSWHYRSRHEALISFSNHNYYEGRLASFPRPPGEHDGLGVRLRRLNGQFERGGARVNRVEVEAIVAELRERLHRDPAASIGVVTFNTQQRELILDRLEELNDQRVLDALGREEESVFVKNLENVQGDERDAILFSLAFSPDEHGRLPLNFGPLVNAGGERRLNVAVTRARAEVVLFASFDPEHIDLGRTSSVGLTHLRAYMEAARSSKEASGVLLPVRGRDGHRDAVVASLGERGLQVRTNVGLSDFTVDIAVARTLDGPWVAVFLDGPDYAKRATVADRETLPHGVLTGAMGWHGSVRVWLPDWLRNAEDALNRVEAALDAPASRPPDAEARKDEAPPVIAPSRPEEAAMIEDEQRPVAPLRSATVAPVLPLIDARQAVAASGTTFIPAHTDLRGFVDDLDAMTRDDGARVRVRREIDDVIASEGPVALARLARIVARRFDLQRVSSKRAAAIVALVPDTQIDRTAVGDFAWPENVNPSEYVEVRTSAAGEGRVITEIAPQEVLNAMAQLARMAVAISEDELIRETAASFGIRRLTVGIREHLGTILDLGCDAATLARAGDFVRATEMS